MPKISALPASGAALLTDMFPIVQSALTKKETLQQVLTLFNTNIQISEAQVTNLVFDLGSKQDASPILTSLASVSATSGVLVKTSAFGVAATLTPSLTSLALATPLPVTSGGSGVASLTQNGIPYGNATSAVGVTTAGTTGQVLIGSTGAAPAFGNNLFGDLLLSNSTSATDRTLAILNNSNTSTSDAVTLLQVGGSSAGDPVVQYQVLGVGIATAGVDNSDGDSFAIAMGANLGTNNVVRISTAGEINFPLQPAFLAIQSANLSNLTGNGTAYSIICNNEIYDQSNDYNNTTGVYTAPITAKHSFSGGATWTSLDVVNDTGNLLLVTSNRTYALWNGYIGVIRNGSGQAGFITSTDADMDAGDTAFLQTVVSGGTKIVGLLGDSAVPVTMFAGKIIC